MKNVIKNKAGSAFLLLLFMLIIVPFDLSGAQVDRPSEHRKSFYHYDPYVGHTSGGNSPEDYRKDELYYEYGYYNKFQDDDYNCYLIVSEENREALLMDSYTGNIPASVVNKATGVRYTVTGIGPYAIRSSVEKVEIPETITRIWDYAFYNTSITSLTIPPTVTVIDKNAFVLCKSLKSVEIPPSLEQIGSYMFAGCSALEEIEIPDGITDIGDGAFADCKSLKEIKIPESVTTIGYGAFAGCAIRELYIPKSVTTMDYGNPFFGCESLENVVLDSANQDYTIEDGALYNKNRTKIIALFSNIKEFSIPEGVDSIVGSVFRDRAKLGEITIPASVKYIGESAFEDCISLKTIHANPVSCPEMYSDIFKNVRPDVVVYVRFGSVNSYMDNQIWAVFKNYEEVGTFVSKDIMFGITSEEKKEVAAYKPVRSKDYSYGSYKFSSDKMFSMAFPSEVEYDNCTYTVTSISDRFFYHQDELREVYIPKTVVSIGEEAFFSCSELQSVNIPNSVVSIGCRSFYWCRNLKSVLIPSSVDTIKEGTFDSCYSLSSIYVNSAVPPKADMSAFDGVQRSAKIFVPVGSLPAYQASAPWNEFINIYESDFAALTDITNDQPAGSNDVYSLQGICLKRNATEADIDALPEGIYIIGGRKVYVK